MSGIKGMRHSRPRPSKHTDSIEVAKIENLLSRHYLGEHKLSNTQLKAIEIRYSRLRPTLSAVEQIQQDPRDKGNPDQILNALIAKLSEKPELFVKLVQAVPALQEQLRCLFATNAVQHEPQSTVLADTTSKTLIQ